MRMLAAALVVLAVSSQAGQQPARDQPAQRPGFGTGGVAGRVVNGETRQPVADALVALIGGQTATIRVGQTDAKGMFILPAVPAGKFVLSASKAPYLGSMFGAPKAGRPGTAVVLTEGQVVAGLEILMWPGAVVTGTVTDHDGEPVAGAEVQLQRRGRGDQMSQMLAVLGGVPSATTDDRGIYRIFGIAPGDYLVMASVPDTLARSRKLGPTEVADGFRALSEPPRAAGRGAPAAPPADAPPLPVRFGPGGSGVPASSSHAPVYFPGTADMSRATTVSVAMGEERSGVNIGLEIVPLVRVGGTVFGADGVGAASILITLQRLDETPFMAMLQSALRTSQTAANGQFSVRNVAPGRYRVLARSARTQQAASTSTFWASADLTIGGQDVGGLVLQLQPALTITGRVAIDDTATTARPELTSVRAGFIPLDADVSRDQLGMFASIVGGAGGQAARADGSFEVGGLVPGSYLAMATVGSENPLSLLTWRVGAVAIDGRDVTDLPFDVKSDALPKTIQITLTDKHQKLSGVIADTSGRPLTASTVLMFATDRRYWHPQSRRVLAVRPGTDGSYEFSGLLGPSAGEYFLSVVTDLESGQEYDQAFLDALAKAGPIRLTLGRGESKRQDLKVR